MKISSALISTGLAVALAIGPGLYLVPDLREDHAALSQGEQTRDPATGTAKGEPMPTAKKPPQSRGFIL